jgi:hypothetical protein
MTRVINCGLIWEREDIDRIMQPRENDTMTDLTPMQDYRISYCGPNGRGKYTGVWAVPGDCHWRTLRDWTGENSYFDSPNEAVAYAGQMLCYHLNKSVESHS